VNALRHLVNEADLREYRREYGAKLKCHTWLYFIGSDAPGLPIKVGIAGDPFDRLSQLQSANPSRLQLLAACWSSATEERLVHSLLIEQCIHHEWFWSSDELLAAITQIRVWSQLDLLNTFPKRFDHALVSRHQAAVAEIMEDAAA
jgi:hypothetical protein